MDYAEFGGGNLMVEAMNAGAIDFASWSEIPLVFAAAANANVKAIAVQRADVNRQAVIVPQGSAIRTIGDLRGKRVGYVRATTSHYFLLKMLQQAGLGFADISPIPLSLPTAAPLSRKVRWMPGRSMATQSISPSPRMARVS